MKYDIDWQHGISEHELQEITDRKQAITLPTQDEEDDDLGTFDSLEEAVEDQPPQAENNKDKDEEEDPYGGGMSITLANRIKEYKKFNSSLLDEKALPKNNKSQDYTKLSNQRQGIESSSSSSSFSASFDESATAAANSRQAPPPTQHQSKRHQPTAFGDGDWI